MSLLEINGLSISYPGSAVVLDRLSFAIEKPRAHEVKSDRANDD